MLMTLQDISGFEVDPSSVPELQPQENANEGDQPSPVSILQTSCHDDFSFSSECFEGLNADLQGISVTSYGLSREYIPFVNLLTFGILVC